MRPARWGMATARQGFRSMVDSFLCNSPSQISPIFLRDDFRVCIYRMEKLLKLQAQICCVDCGWMRPRKLDVDDHSQAFAGQHSRCHLGLFWIVGLQFGRQHGGQSHEDLVGNGLGKLRRFFAWYNHEHRHSGIGMMTPASVHEGRAEAIRAVRPSWIKPLKPTPRSSRRVVQSRLHSQIQPGSTHRKSRKRK